MGTENKTIQEKGIVQDQDQNVIENSDKLVPNLVI